MPLPAQTGRRAPSSGPRLAPAPPPISGHTPALHTRFTAARFTAVATWWASNPPSSFLPRGPLHELSPPTAVLVCLIMHTSAHLSLPQRSLLSLLLKKPPHYYIFLPSFVPSALSSQLICFLTYLFVCLTARQKPRRGMNVVLVTAVSSDRSWHNIMCQLNAKWMNEWVEHTLSQVGGCEDFSSGSRTF